MLFRSYRHQVPHQDLPAIVTTLLRDESGPILDVGCGDGRYVRALLSDQPERPVIGADLSAGMIGAAVAATGCGGTVADATMLPLRDDTVGAVMALHMLYHVPDPAAALAEFARVVRPSGTVLLSTNAWGDKAEMRELHAAAAAEMGAAVPDYGLSLRFHLDDAETAARRQFAAVERIDLTSAVEVTTPEPVVAFIASSAAWFDRADGVLDAVHRRVEAAIATAGVFRIRTHVGFLVCR